MTPSVEMKPLSQKKRRFVFLLSLFLFVIAVPFSVFYAIGYRFDFSDDITNIKSVGGMYVRNDVPDTEMFVNEAPIKDMRVFQKAAYIQNLEAGMHRVHVQGDQVQTWVKELPVYAHYVTEVSSFNVPRVPQIRLVTEWIEPTQNLGVLFEEDATSSFAFASVTTPVLFAPATTSTSTLTTNTEYVYVQSLLASSTQLRAQRGSHVSGPGRFIFGSELATTSTVTLAATTTVVWRDFMLFENEGEVYVRYTGSLVDVPYYYCVLYTGKNRTTLEYGEHVYDALVAQNENLFGLTGSRVCRTEIRIDRQNQMVHWFGFFPDSTDMVLMLLDDGLYVVEVDDRAWQNNQLLYPGEDLQVTQDGGRIYVQDGEYLFEVYTEIASQ